MITNQRCLNSLLIILPMTAAGTRMHVSMFNKTCLRVDNFRYYKESEENGTIQWKCTVHNCSSRVETNCNLSSKKVKNAGHCHLPKSDDFFLSNEIRRGVKRRISLDPSERPQKAVDLLIKDIPVNALNNLNVLYSYYQKQCACCLA